MSEDGKNNRTYIVFTQDDNGLWEELARVEANGHQPAIRKASSDNGVYVAVPERSFQPMRLETATRTSTRLVAA